MKLIVQETAPGRFVELQSFDISGLPTIIVTGSGADAVRHNWNITQLWSDAALNAVGIYRVDPAPVPANATITGHHFERINGVVTHVYNTTPFTKDDLLAASASARYSKETTGIVVNSVSVATDRQSQAMLTGAYNNAMRDSTWTTQWKGAAGFALLTAQQVIALAIAVGMHVDACFKKEADVASQIAAGTITTVDQINAAYAAINTAYTT